MKKEYKFIAILFFGVILILFFKKVFEYFLNIIIDDKLLSDEIGNIISRAVLLICLLWVILKYKFNKLDYFKFNFYNLRVIIIPVTILLVSIVNNIQVYSSVSASLLTTFGISQILTGFVEEFLFRGLVFALLVKALSKNKNGLRSAIIFSSVLFGLMHFINYFKTPRFDMVISQVVFACCMGYFSCGLLLKTRNIYIIALIHAAFNFAFGFNIEPETVLADPKPASVISILLTLLLYSSLVLAGHILSRQARKENDILQFEKIEI